MNLDTFLIQLFTKHCFIVQNSISTCFLNSRSVISSFSFTWFFVFSHCFLYSAHHRYRLSILLFCPQHSEKKFDITNIFMPWMGTSFSRFFLIFRTLDMNSFARKYLLQLLVTRYCSAPLRIVSCKIFPVHRHVCTLWCSRVKILNQRITNLKTIIWLARYDVIVRVYWFCPHRASVWYSSKRHISRWVTCYMVGVFDRIQTLEYTPIETWHWKRQPFAINHATFDVLSSILQDGWVNFKWPKPNLFRELTLL